MSTIKHRVSLLPSSSYLGDCAVEVREINFIFSIDDAREIYKVPTIILQPQTSNHLQIEALPRLDAVLVKRPIAATVIALYSVHYIIRLTYNDYQDFLSLGPGGTPSNVSGYLRIKFLSFFKLRDPYKPIMHTEPTQIASTYLMKLPKRQSPRPIVRGIAPHRQMNQRSSPQIFSVLSAKIKGLASIPKNQLGIGTSCFEKHSTGLFSLSPAFPTCGGEVCHAHASDGSMHMTLHPSDAATVLACGWGERHPLARGGWLSRFVPLNFIMVYAPRDAAEIDIVMKIVSAACFWVGGRQVTQVKPIELYEDEKS